MNDNELHSRRVASLTQQVERGKVGRSCARERERV